MHFLSSQHLNTFFFFLFYSKLKFIPSTFKALANIALLGHLRLHHAPSWNVITQNMLIPFPSKPDPQEAKIRPASLPDLPRLPLLRNWQFLYGRKKKLYIIQYAMMAYSLCFPVGKVLPFRFPSLWRWYRKEAIASWSYIIPNSSQMGMSQSFNKWY